MNLKAQTVYIKSDKKVADYYLCEAGKYEIEVVGYVETKTAIVLTGEELQQEKDKFAVGFTEWKEKNKYNKGIINYWKTGKDHEIPLEFSLSQLIDIYTTTKEKV